MTRLRLASLHFAVSFAFQLVSGVRGAGLRKWPGPSLGCKLCGVTWPSWSGRGRGGESQTARADSVL